MKRNTPLVALDARLVAGMGAGDSTYWTGLLYGLERLDPDIRIVLFSDQPRPADLPYGRSFEWHQLRAKTSRWWSLVAFPLAARRLRATASHTQYTVSPLLGQGAITTIHDVSFYIGPQWFKPRDRFLLRNAIPSTVKRAAKVITVSKTSKAEIESWLPDARGKTVVTYNACPPWIRAVDREEARKRVESECGIRDRYVLTVGTRWPRKNMALATKAASLLPAQVPHRIVVTGKHGWGDDAPGPRGLATGYVSNELLSCLFSAADLYLAPSHHEGFGIPLLEAFRCGCPVMCSRGGAFPEVADGAAHIESSWEPEAWAASIERLLREPSTLDDLRRRGHEREKAFTWEECARRTLEVYREVAS
jgi:glycosyltransferase involved in cell wall biosynthesis